MVRMARIARMPRMSGLAPTEPVSRRGGPLLVLFLGGGLGASYSGPKSLRPEAQSATATWSTIYLDARL